MSALFSSEQLSVQIASLGEDGDSLSYIRKAALGTFSQCSTQATRLLSRSLTVFLSVRNTRYHTIHFAEVKIED